jgi:hypothetical protein
VKRSKRVRRVVVSADGLGVVSHAGAGLLREMAGYTGLVEGVTGALIGTCKGVPTHAPGRVFTDLAVAVADGADAISGIGVLTDREELFGPVASMPATWRVLDRVGPEQFPTVRAARAKARAAAWAAGAGPDLGEELRLGRRGDPEGVGGHQHRPTPSAPAAAVSRTTMLAFSALGNTDALATSRRMSRPDIGLAMTPAVASATSRWRLTREPLACCSPIALPARRRRACLLRDTRFRSR